MSSNRAGFFGDSRCAQLGVQLCDGFEGDSLDRTTWGVVGTPPVVDGAQHARGSKALHITQNGNGPSYIRELKTFPEPNDAYFGRIFVYFSSLPGAPLDYAHWTIVGASGSGVLGEIRVGGQFQGGINLFGVGTDSLTDPAGTGDWTTSDDDPSGSPQPVPLNQWLCLEWMHDGSTNETRFYWDGVEHASLYTTSTMNGGNGNPYALPAFSALWIGWQEYQSTTEVFDMWVDEVAIDTRRIGCSM